jgi:hypothetical protein
MKSITLIAPLLCRRFKMVRAGFSSAHLNNSSKRIPPLSSFPGFESGAITQTEQIVGLHRKAVLHSKTCRPNGSVPSTRSVLERGVIAPLWPRIQDKFNKGGMRPIPQWQSAFDSRREAA